MRTESGRGPAHRADQLGRLSSCELWVVWKEGKGDLVLERKE